ncbi:MAG: NAD(P)/FAD-dependent oxidoreductase [Anaerolineae bacterium]
MKNQNRHVMIIGAGIMGASLSYHLAQAGAQVTILEKGEPGQGTTADSFAWINASRGKTPYHYYQLNLFGIAAWERLEQELEGALKVKWGGSVEWELEKDEAEHVNQATQTHQAWGYPLQFIDADQLAKLEPNLQTADFETAVYTEIEGHVDPVYATKVLLKHALQMGAVLQTNCNVTAIDPAAHGTRNVKTSQGDFTADTIVIACGNHSPKIAEMAGFTIPLKDSPGVLVHAKPQPDVINRIVLSPHGHMKQKPDGRIVLGSSFEGGGGTDNSVEAGESLLKHAASSLPQLDKADVEKVTLGWRVLPEDGLPIIGFAKQAPDIYVATMHSGITLAPLVGKYAVAEILEELEVDQLQHYRLDRFDTAKT